MYKIGDHIRYKMEGIDGKDIHDGRIVADCGDRYFFVHPTPAVGFLTLSDHSSAANALPGYEDKLVIFISKDRIVGFSKNQTILKRCK